VALRLYRLDVSGKPEIANDNVLPFSTLGLDDDQKIRLSAYSTLKVTLTKEHRAACRRIFQGKAVRLGDATFEGTGLKAVVDAGKTVVGVGKAISESPVLPVFLTWDPDVRNLMLVDRFGLVPGLESSIFEMQPGPDEGLPYLHLDAKFKIKRDKH
jgi:hypothetical protein